MKKIIDQIRDLSLLPVVIIENPNQTQELGQALIQGGLPCAEITFRTQKAAQAISNLAKQFPEMLVGAGTILNVDSAQQAVEAGAQFIVSPGFSPKVVEWCLQQDVLVVPGVATPSEIMQALEWGLSVLKFFPADILGGPSAIKAIGAAFAGVKFIPTGGISPANLSAYLSLPMVLACGGSWMVSRSLIEAGKFEKVTELAIEARKIILDTRGQGGN
jgi:2-dehydro-3-deoxyphosphogluconate aldolase/(4S)-4-hydroxy-2-oxoglutarate aldolase